MAIIGTLPNQILDGQIIDAVPVMNDFNWIVNQVNANAQPLGGGSSGTTFATYVPAAAVGGSANAILLTPTPAIGAYAEGQSYRFRATNTNTGATTIATSGLAVRAVQTASGASLTGGEILAGGEYDVTDTGTVYQLVNASQGTGVKTFTPGITFGGASVGVTYGTQQGNYFKLGPMVFFSLSLGLTNKGSSVGAARITGLPYTIGPAWPTGGAYTTFPLACINTNFTGAANAGYLIGGGDIPGTTIALINVVPNSGVYATLTDASLANNASFIVSGTYFTS